MGEFGKHLVKRAIAFYLTVLLIIFNLFLTFSAWIWWLAKMEPADSFAFLLTSAIMHPIIVYETGYKRCYRRGMRKYFYVVYLLPGILSMMGIVLGILIKGIP